MTPYYEDDFVTIYHGDCRVVLPSVRDRDRVATVITDPPYGVGYVSNRRQADLFGEIVGDDALDMGWLGLLQTDEWVTAYVFANDDSLVATQQGVIDAGWGFNTLLVWDKQAPSMGDLASYGKRTEFIVFAVNHPRRSARRLNGSRDHNLISVPRVDTRRMVHPTEKPVDLIAYLVLKSTDPGELVLDPFMGSGPSLLAAKRLGRKAIGIEIEERYCEIAARRLSQEVLDFGGVA